ncbi:hypothetical protein V8D89_004943 [Ganoderma adspersum]
MDTGRANVRADLESRGTQLGLKATVEDASSGKTQDNRGLIFVPSPGCITNGF